ncbi:MAG: hypothetical protein QM655_10655, partial [Nocardioidaceae bacterium]
MQRAKPETGGDQLPEPVAVRAREFAAAALASVPSDVIPPVLRRAASFVPARRAQVAGTQILERRLTDDRFRDALAVQLRGTHAALAEEVAALDPDGEAPSLDAIALGYLLDLPGWRHWAEQMVAAAQEARLAAERQHEAREVARLEDRIAELETERATLAARHGDQLAKLKRDNAELRRRLGEARAAARAAQAQAQIPAAPAAEPLTAGEPAAGEPAAGEP